jgi:hypothetical protein
MNVVYMYCVLPRVNIEYWHMCQILKSLVNISLPHFSYFKNKEEAYFLLTHVFVMTSLTLKKKKNKKKNVVYVLYNSD